MATMLTEQELEQPEDPTAARQITLTVDVSEHALRRVRAGFNPDKLQDVGKLHLLGAMFITLLESHYRKLPKRDEDPSAPEHVEQAYQRDLYMATEQNRHVAMAVTHAETATMFGVKAATTDIYSAKNLKR